jgi:hypothetical protein
MTAAITAILASMVLIWGPVAAAGEWSVKPEPGKGCILESSPASLTDGYQNTTARIRVDGKTIWVFSPSVFDASFNDIGIAVDTDSMIPMDKLADQRTAVFESRYGALVDQFKRGLSARLQLRFWPTWPATGTHSATVSLIGFTRAYARLEECK